MSSISTLAQIIRKKSKFSPFYWKEKIQLWCKSNQGRDQYQFWLHRAQTSLMQPIFSELSFFYCLLRSLIVRYNACSHQIAFVKDSSRNWLTIWRICTVSLQRSSDTSRQTWRLEQSREYSLEKRMWRASKLKLPQRRTNSAKSWGRGSADCAHHRQ